MPKTSKIAYDGIGRDSRGRLLPGYHPPLTRKKAEKPSEIPRSSPRGSAKDHPAYKTLVQLSKNTKLGAKTRAQIANTLLTWAVPKPRDDQDYEPVFHVNPIPSSATRPKRILQALGVEGEYTERVRDRYGESKRYWGLLEADFERMAAPRSDEPSVLPSSEEATDPPDGSHRVGG